MITSPTRSIVKRLVILDVMTIASLFLLRVVAGAVAVEAHASEWLLLCTAMLALFLGFTKRRQEAMSLPPEASLPPARSPAKSDTRPVLEHYSLPFLDQMVAMVTAAAIISYAIYAVNSPIIGTKMLATAPSVLYGIFRYLYLIYDRRGHPLDGGDPDRGPRHDLRGILGGAGADLGSTGRAPPDASGRRVRSSADRDPSAAVPSQAGAGDRVRAAWI